MRRFIAPVVGLLLASALAVALPTVAALARGGGNPGGGGMNPGTGTKNTSGSGSSAGKGAASSNKARDAAIETMQRDEDRIQQPDFLRRALDEVLAASRESDRGL